MMFWTQGGPNLRAYLRCLFRPEGRRRLSRFLLWEAPLPRRAFSSGGMSSLFEVSPPRPPPSVSSATWGRLLLLHVERIPGNFRTPEVAIGGSKVRSSPQKITYPGVLTCLTFDPQLESSANSSKDYRGKQRKFRPSSETTSY